MNRHPTPGNGDEDTVMKAKNEDAVIAAWARLLATLKTDIEDDYRATDDPDDETPAMCVTFGVTVADDGNLSWSYQTGDNSYTGGAYGHPYWGVVTLTRESDCGELAMEAMEEAMEEAIEGVEDEGGGM